VARLTLAPDSKDPYVDGLSRWIRTSRDERLLDRLVMGGVVEARGCERFGMVAVELTRSEARHVGLFHRLARRLFPAAEVDARVRELLEFEGGVIAQLKLRPALH
jgi:tRNA-(ms[2]io[6]A)-hydroxylase